MDGKGRVTDNAFTERFRRSIKYEYIYLNPNNNVMEPYHGSDRYIKYYSEKLRQGKLANRTPLKVYIWLHKVFHKKNVNFKRSKIFDVDNEVKISSLSNGPTSWGHLKQYSYIHMHTFLGNLIKLVGAEATQKRDII